MVLSGRRVTDVVLAMLLVCAGLSVVFMPAIALAVPAALLLAWLAYRRPALLILALLVWLPIEGWALKFVPGGSVLLAVPDAASALLGVALLLRLSTRGIDRSEGTAIARIIGPLVALLAVALVSWLVNRPPIVDAVYWVRVYLRFVPVALSLANQQTRATVAAFLPQVATAVVFSQSLIGLAEYVGGPTVAAFFWTGQYALGAVTSQVDTLATVGGRVVAGTFGHYNVYGMTLVLWIGVLLGALSERLEPSGVRSSLRALVLALGSVMVLLSQSRQATIMLVGLYLAWLLGASVVSAKARMAGVVSALGGVILVVVDASVGIQALLSRVGDLGDAWFWTVQVAKNRGYVVTGVMTAILERAPMLGMGPGSFGTSYGSSLGPVGVSALGLDAVGSRFVGDVGWIALLSQVGVLGVGAVVWLGLRIARVLRRPNLSGAVRYGGIAAMLLLVVGMLASTPLTYKGPSSAFWVIVGLVLTSHEAGLVESEREYEIVSDHPETRSTDNVCTGSQFGSARRES